MALRRLTKSQKIKILEAFRKGQSTQALSEEFNCSPNTISRTVKLLISPEEYAALKEERAKDQSQKSKTVYSELLPGNKKNIKENQIKKKEQNFSEQKEVSLVDKGFSMNAKSDDNPNLDFIAVSVSNEDENPIKENSATFEEIAPLISSFGFETEKQKVACQSLDIDDLPDTVYMLVDKKVELESQMISELSEWSFLPENEKERQAIILFSDQRSAKRSCSRNQRVIKIPNTNIFKLSKPYLISKGITRLILEDSLIGLDLN